MTGKVLLAIGLALIFMIPSILLIEGAQKELAEENKKIVTLKLNILETAFTGFISLINTSIGIGLLYTSFNTPEMSVLLKILVIGIAGFFLIDFPLFCNHLIQIKTQSVIIDKEKNAVSITKSGREIIIDLEDDEYEVIRYEPRWKGVARGKPPGADFGKTVILKGNATIELSDLLLKNYKLFTLFNEKEDRTFILRQINFIK